MSKDNHSIFSREHSILKQAEEHLNSGIPPDDLIFHYQSLVKKYKKLLRQTETLTRVSDNQQRKLNSILERLGRYVSIQLFKKITEGREKVEIETQRKKLTVFFSDIKDFAYTASNMEGEALSIFLNSYLEIMTQIVIKWGGTLDKYMGDAIMVFFGDPEFISDEDHALRCVKMAVEMRERMKILQKKWYDLGYQNPLQCRMGIATGYCTVGNFGSSERMDYTIIGTPVNLASRLETAADVDEIFISHETWGLVREEVVCAPPVALNLKGFHQPILTHRVMHLKDHDRQSMFVICDEEKGDRIEVDLETVTKDELIRLLQYQESLKYNALHDPVTGFLNRAPLLRRLDSEISRASREENHLCIALICLHTGCKGDEPVNESDFNLLLKDMAARIVKVVRNYDTLGRFDKNTFILISPGTDLAAASFQMERIREAVESNPVLLHGVPVFTHAATSAAALRKDMTARSLIHTAETLLEKHIKQKTCENKT